MLTIAALYGIWGVLFLFYLLLVGCHLRFVTRPQDSALRGFEMVTVDSISVDTNIDRDGFEEH